MSNQISFSYESVIAAISKILTNQPEIEMTIARRAGVAFEDVYPAMRVICARGGAIEALNAERDLVYRAA